MLWYVNKDRKRELKKVLVVETLDIFIPLACPQWSGNLKGTLYGFSRMGDITA